MKQESLDLALVAIIQVLDEVKIDSVDKTELMKNLYTLMYRKENYDRGIKVLQKDQDLNRKNRF